MSLVKSFSVGNGDTFYIQHNSDNFTLIDCSLPDDRADEILDDIAEAKKDKRIARFISTHPDQDHIGGLARLDDRFELLNFYVVKNEAAKPDETEDFKRYKTLRDHPTKAFYVKRGCTRRWMNQGDEARKSSGIKVLWPVLENDEFKAALQQAKDGQGPNNISAVVQYCVQGAASTMWMGDLETTFMESVVDAIIPDPAHILFAPHHGRKSGRVPTAWLDVIDPKIIVVGEAPSDELTYYAGYNTITQNSAGDIVFEHLSGKTHVYVSEPGYSAPFLKKLGGIANSHGYYIGTLYL